MKGLLSSSVGVQLRVTGLAVAPDSVVLVSLDAGESKWCKGNG